jgi:predicted DNA repair protein MutK
MFSLLALLDDIAATLDDVAVMTKVAMKKTSALMSDDLAVNAGVVHGVNPDRELPIVKAIFIGSLVNKVIAIGGALILLAVYPPLLNLVLLLGGLFLCYEGAHKVSEKVFGKKELKEKKQLSEKQKIKGAIKTDLILSIEIIAIAKSALKGTFLEQILALILVGLAASLIIYGLVAILVKIDDFGLYLIKKGYKGAGSKLVYAMPFMMKGLGILGTTAMFLVGGGIFSHQFHLPLYAPEMLQNLVLGVIMGALTLPLVGLVMKLKKPNSAA